MKKCYELHQNSNSKKPNIQMICIWIDNLNKYTIESKFTIHDSFKNTMQIFTHEEKNIVNRSKLFILILHIV